MGKSPVLAPNFFPQSANILRSLPGLTKGPDGPLYSCDRALVEGCRSLSKGVRRTGAAFNIFGTAAQKLFTFLCDLRYLEITSTSKIAGRREKSRRNPLTEAKIPCNMVLQARCTLLVIMGCWVVPAERKRRKRFKPLGSFSPYLIRIMPA